ncbi:MAG: Cna B-type domain-containing protein [Clostridia bacterium]|nr:Cna B-type domain-containing protein [Clostridia bacterium]
MKRIKKLLVALLAAALFVALIGASVSALAIEPMRKSSLTLQYKHGEVFFEGAEIKTYRVAEVFADGTFALCGDFADYPINIYGITSQAQWRGVTSALAAYATADGISPTRTSVTDETGTVSFTDILPGMYLTLSVHVETGKEIAIFESFLTVIPAQSESGEHNYDVTAYPKCEKYTPKPDPIEYKVVKQWQDNGYDEKRPEYVEVDIIKNGEIQHSVKLSADNNWSYGWSAEDDGGEWQAVERNIPSDYTVSIVKNGNIITITNIFENPSDPPPTGDTTVIWHYVLILCLSGAVLIVIATWRKRAE